MRRIFSFRIHGIIMVLAVVLGTGHATAGETGRSAPERGWINVNAWWAENRNLTAIDETPARIKKTGWAAGPEDVIHADLLAAMQCLAPPDMEPVADPRHFHRSWPYFDSKSRPRTHAGPPVIPIAQPVVVRIVWQKKTRRRGAH